MLGILMVATLPVAARRRWCLPSDTWSEALKIGVLGFCFLFGGWGWAWVPSVVRKSVCWLEASMAAKRRCSSSFVRFRPTRRRYEPIVMMIRSLVRRSS